MATVEQLDQVHRRLEEVIRQMLPVDEVIVHYDVLVESRCGSQAQTIRFRRFSSPGSSPLLSLGLLTAIKGRLRQQLGISSAAE